MRAVNCAFCTREVPIEEALHGPTLYMCFGCLAVSHRVMLDESEVYRRVVQRLDARRPQPVNPRCDSCGGKAVAGHTDRFGCSVCLRGLASAMHESPRIWSTVALADKPASPLGVAAMGADLALGHFELGEFPEALAAAIPVVLNSYEGSPLAGRILLDLLSPSGLAQFRAKRGVW